MISLEEFPLFIIVKVQTLNWMSSDVIQEVFLKLTKGIPLLERMCIVMETGEIKMEKMTMIVMMIKKVHQEGYPKLVGDAIEVGVALTYSKQIIEEIGL